MEIDVVQNHFSRKAIFVIIVLNFYLKMWIIKNKIVINKMIMFFST